MMRRGAGERARGRAGESASPQLPLSLSPPLPLSRTSTRSHCHTLTLSLLLLVPAITAAAAQDEAADTVVLRLDATGARAVVSGSVIDYTGEIITIRTKADGPVRAYPAAQVVEVRTPQTEAHRIGLQNFAQNRIAEAKTAFERALQDEPRTWVRRDILALLVRCALRQGDHHKAAARFLLLVKSDPATPHFKLIPLVWAPLEVPADLKIEARAWLSQSNEVARLIGASVLFGVAEERGPAHTALNKLVTSADSRIRALAAAQLWRLRLGAGELSRFEIDRFQARIEEMPEVLRGGPYYLLGRAFAQQGERERAVWAWLWVPLVYDHDHHLAARSSLEAADTLSSMSRPQEAIVLYREVTARFAGTPFAREAETALSTLEAKIGNGEPPSMP